MAEDFNLSSLVIPGTYIRVRADALISAGGVSTGNIGIVGTAVNNVAGTEILSDFNTGLATFGAADATHNLTRALEVLFRNGAAKVFARSVAAGADTAAFTAAFNELIKEDVNILIAPELSTSDAMGVLKSLVESSEGKGKDMIAVVGSDATAVADIKAQVQGSPRIILVAPGIEMPGSDDPLPGTLSAAAVAALLSSLTPQTSPTNKTLPGATDVATRFSIGELEDLLNSHVLVLENRNGVRVVRGLTTDDGAFTQITTRRIVDFAKAGIRKAGDPFIGRLNNQRVRKALQGAIDGFLNTMLQDEALTSYALQVVATRQDEIAGRAVVNAVLQPTFSIDFIAVTLVLQ